MRKTISNYINKTEHRSIIDATEILRENKYFAKSKSLYIYIYIFRNQKLL